MPRPRVIDLDLRPLIDDPVDLGIQRGARTWRASSADPAFTATVPAGKGALEPGWYSASAVIEQRGGAIEAPTLYIPDQGGRCAEERSVEMLRRERAYVADFFLPHAVRHLRFDPSRSPCEFACEALQVAAIRVPADEPGGVKGLLRRLGRGAARAASPTVQVAIPPDRKARVLATIDREGVGLEIGPCHDPIAPKRDGFKVEVIDHASREELVAKYGDVSMPHDQIEEVDYIWHGESYLDLVKKPAHYDWIIASHLIEHTPDLIAFLVNCDALLKDTGVLSLVIPDKRYVFDRFRPVTGLARVIDSHLAGAKVHSPGAVAEHLLNAVGKAHQLGWYQGALGAYNFIHSAQQTRDIVAEIVTKDTKDTYRDIHNWCFTPHSFRLLIEDLHALGYTRLREAQFHGTEGCEFYATLGRRGAGPGMTRLALLKAIDTELATLESS